MGIYRLLAERFWGKVDKSAGLTGCWIWVGCRDSKGYGVIRVGGKNIGTHRVAWEMTNGPIPEGGGSHGTCIIHRCDVRLCVNPAHLESGSQADNMADMIAKGRARHDNPARGIANNKAKLTESDVLAIRTIGHTVTQRELARRFGVHQSVICHILLRKLWAHLPLYP